jgi:hypothetical protein
MAPAMPKHMVTVNPIDYTLKLNTVTLPES